MRLKMKTVVLVVPYNPEWPAIFAKEAVLIKRTLGDNCHTIHHVGSTSIPGMFAKPIIDMIPVVTNIQLVDEMAAEMVKLGYQAKGEGGMLFRRFFTKSVDTEAFNVHVYEEGAGEIDRLIKFRDWMCSHQQDADEYARLKLKLAGLHSDDLLKYVMGKEELIVSIDAKTHFAGLRIVQALSQREWEAYHRIRKQEIFDVMGIEYDPNHFTMRDLAHVHLVLYHGSNIVGVAQLERLAGGEAALRPFAIDRRYQNRGLGSIFLANIERWLRQQGCRLLRLHASPLAVRFYERHGYSAMPFLDRDRADIEDVDMGKEL
jgi:GrpB-like predicted nucleotidyltransferase (UPF0157 family)/GNAT superfamily N-acetyltransferase